MTEILSNSILEEIQKQIPGIDLSMGLKRGEGLKELMQKSELVGGDPAREESFIELVKKVKWIGTATELSYFMEKSKSSLKPQNPYVLGISNWLDATNAYGAMVGGQQWPDAYLDFNIDIKDDRHTIELMQKLTNSKKDIVFFLPPNLYSYRSPADHIPQHVTRDEVDWLMNNSEKAENVWLVFGGYNLISESWRKEHLSEYSQDQIIKLLEKSLQKWVNILF